MKVISINTSSRKNCNTSYACRTLADAVAGKDGLVTHFNISALDICPCKSCYACEVKGKCVVQDDWQKILDPLWEADAVVFGTPVYMLRESAWARIFIERSKSLLSHTEKMGKKGMPVYQAFREYRREHPDEYQGLPAVRLPKGKKVYIVVTQYNPNPFAAEQVMEHLEFIFIVVGGEIKKKWIITGTLEPHDLEKWIEEEGPPPEIFNDLESSGSALSGI